MKNLSAEEESRLFPENTILAGYVGSISHGTYRPSSDENSIDDKDVLGIYIAPISEYFGMRRPERKQQREYKKDEWDVVVYEIAKMFSLITAANPNVMSLLWLNDQFYVRKSPLGKIILDNRDLFSSRKAYHSFSGYAHAQLYKMEHLAFEGYMGDKRKKIVEKFGYDTKNASHLIRILRMGIEFMLEGKLYVYREDSPELVSIKRGEWTLDRVKDESNRLFRLAEEAYVKSQLPNEPDTGKINEMLVNILRYHFKES